LSRIHFINAQRPIISNSIATTLLSYPLCHEECLVGFLWSEPIKIKSLKIWK
jgi:hypothetical protein